MTVTMTDVEEDGVVTITPPRGWEGTRFTRHTGRRRRPNVSGSVTRQWAAVHQPFELARTFAGATSGTKLIRAYTARADIRCICTCGSTASYD